MSAGLRTIVWALLLGLAMLWWLSRPLPLAPDSLPGHVVDLANGERIFHAGGCASCHSEPGIDQAGDDRLPGGLELTTPYGMFRVPNISPDLRSGIGNWSDLDFANAMMRGVAPDGRHYYPSFPYTSYARMSMADVLDLRAFLATLEPVSTPSRNHELKFPYGFRRALGLWKRLFLVDTPAQPVDESDMLLVRGRYLVEGPGHCGECHTPRNGLGALRLDAWLSGARSLEGEGKVPDITPTGLADWPEGDIAYYLESGIDPEFDVVGGSMVKVQENMARLSAEDREAIAAYLKYQVSD